LTGESTDRMWSGNHEALLLPLPQLLSPLLLLLVN
jgi:hypothetical protein